MSELTTNQLIKIIVGFFVVAVVILGVYLIFQNKILTFFQVEEHIENNDSSQDNSIQINQTPNSSQKPQINLVPIDVKT
ncbi:MAG: hypothetical protein KC516_01790 [Nanoarchaeota archaeon]|nr:hypothetical protein [Nanoarchaeota archaeon]